MSDTSPHTHLDPHPIEPGSDPYAASHAQDELEIQDTIRSISSTPRPVRIATGLVLLVLGLAAVAFGTVLLHSTCASAPVVLLFIEPAGVFLVCVAVVELAPQGRVLRCFRASYYRLRLALLVVAITAGIGATLLIGLLVFELLKT